MPVEPGELLQITRRLVLDRCPFLIRRLYVARDILFPARSDRRSNVEVELVVDNLPESGIAIDLVTRRGAISAEAPKLRNVFGRFLHEKRLMRLGSESVGRAVILSGDAEVPEHRLFF